MSVVEVLLSLALSALLVQSVSSSSLRLSRKELLDLENRGDLVLPNGKDRLEIAVTAITVRASVFAVWVIAVVVGLFCVGLSEYLILGYLLFITLVVSVLFYKISLRLLK